MHQTVVLDLENGSSDIRPAAASENIADALNYYAVSERLIEFVGASRFLLIETLAEQCAALVLREFGVRWLRGLQLAIHRGGSGGKGSRCDHRAVGALLMPRVYIGIGSNIEAERYVAAGLDRLGELFGELLLSPVYKSAAIGFDGAPFLNLVAAFFTQRPIEELAAMQRGIEYENGYLGGTPKFSARIARSRSLAVRGLVWSGGLVQLPRADITDYAYVLWPLVDIAAAEIHPRLRVSYAHLEQ